MARLEWGWVGVLTAALLGGCGGASQSDLFTSSGVDSGGGGKDSGGGKDGGGDGGAGSDSGDPGISCGHVECTAGAQVCCRAGTAPPYDYQCGQQACPDRTLAIPCDDATDCATLGQPGDVCCGSYSVDPMTQNTQIYQVGCRAPSECVNQQLRAILCDPNAVDPCPNDAGTCQMSVQTLPGYDLCVP